MSTVILRPPAQCVRLYEYFCDNDLSPRSSHEALVAIASRGIATSGMPDPDGRIINSGAVGFAQRDELDLLERGNAEGGKRERVSRAQKHRETRDLLANLSTYHQTVLRLAYGDQSQVPGLKLGDNAQARKRLEGQEDEIKNRTRMKAHEKRFGCWRQILPLTKTCIDGHAEHVAQATADHAKEARTSPKAERLRKEMDRSLVQWIVHCAKPSVINEAQREALAIVREAWAAWVSVAGRPARRVRAEAFERVEA
jgi:hypothetical protein